MGNTPESNRVRVAAGVFTPPPPIPRHVQTEAMQSVMDCLLAGCRDGRAGWDAAYAQYVSLSLAEMQHAQQVFSALEMASSHQWDREYQTREGKVSVTPAARAMLNTAYALGRGCAHTGQFVSLLQEYSDRLRSRGQFGPAAVLGHVAYVALMIASGADDVSTRENTGASWAWLTADAAWRRAESATWAQLHASQRPKMSPQQHRALRAFNRKLGKLAGK